MHVKYLQCVLCGYRHSKDEIRFRCHCGGSLDVIYDYREIKGKVSWKKLRTKVFNHWRYREFFPLVSDKNMISLKEGGTPLLESKNLSKKYKLDLLFKNEGQNPTGSFKDRGTTVEISKALEFNVKQVDCASTGNMGASVAAYCALAGIKARIYVPQKIALSKVSQMLAHGATIVPVKGDYTAALNVAKRDFEIFGTYLMGDYPYRGEGEKSVAYEIADQLNAVPDIIAVPIGGGTLTHGIWKGLRELKTVGLIKKLPRIFGFQAEGCAPVVVSFKKGWDYIEPVKANTIASAIACGDPLDGLEALDALKESKGIGETVSDKEILAAQRLLARQEGIWAEPSGAVSLAGILKLKKKKIVRDERVICLVTGHGLKDPAFY